ncbi:Uma2 family endonuclease [Dethiobacter alkaliphilus]|uniref:Uma2 family endonuclease n=1 Tax=Dethiobacter alkaliphilus TaxID=427926 RepID=UPI00222784C4|nr:Uma2 family endonuclease [Dethiobacter alkaliphilus]MCW3490492.1 Uma2 family endonuclease [Dethiobacter alkaliphilus]
MDSRGLITAQELADSLRLSVDTIWRYTREKRIPYVEIGQRQYRYNKQNVLKALSGEDFCALAKEESAPYQDKKKLTYADYAKLPEEPGYRHEIIDGVLLRDPSPTFHHQRVSRRLQRILEDYFFKVDPKGEVFDAPLDLSLAEYTVVQPDLLYLPGSRPPQNNPIDVVPELVVEVISPSTGKKDRVLKLNHYQAAGILHYWIVDPEEGIIEAYELREGHYVSMVRAHTGTFSHPSFTGLSFDIETLFSKPS